MQLKDATAWFVLLAPLLIGVGDLALFWWGGYYATVTGVVREWAEDSPWPEFIYVTACMVLYYHLFKGWPC